MFRGGAVLAVWISCTAWAWGGTPGDFAGAPRLAMLVRGQPTTVHDSTDLPPAALRGGAVPAAPTGDTAAELPEGHSPARKNWPNPTVTLLKSMAVPGWGQITNHRYFKAAVAIGLETWFIAGAATEWRRASDALDRFRAEPGNLDHYYDYAYHTGNKNDYLWALGATVFISMFDAYVDAHLRPYSEDHIPDVSPPPGVALVVASF